MTVKTVSMSDFEVKDSQIALLSDRCITTLSSREIQYNDYMYAFNKQGSIVSVTAFDKNREAVYITSDIKSVQLWRLVHQDT